MLCDGCDKERRDVKAVGRDSNGDADAPSLCFICRVEAQRGRKWSEIYKRYVHHSDPVLCGACAGEPVYGSNDEVEPCHECGRLRSYD